MTAFLTWKYKHVFEWRIRSMAESQNVEYKELWRDEYLKWVCGFANAQD